MTSKSPGGSDSFRSLVAGFSLANLCLLEVWRQLFSRPEDQYYFAHARSPLDYAGAVIALACLGIVLSGVLLAGHRARPRLPWQLLVGLLTLVPLNIARLNSSFGWTRIKGLATPLSIGVLVLVCAISAPLLWRRRQTLFAGLVVVLLVLSPFTLVTMTRALAGAWTTRGVGLQEERAAPSSTGASEEEARTVVVLLFDELDNRFVDPALRPATLHLPELDRLRGESVVFENAIRPGPETLISMPALINGMIVDEAIPRGISNLELVRDGQVSVWGQQPNLFGLAMDAGVPVHLVGWYQPYCRVFPRVTSCSWQPHSEYFVGHGDGLVEKAAENIASLSPFNRRRLGVRAYERILADAKTATAKRGLIWIHFPIPHKPVIYDRKTMEITSWNDASVAGYLDNVALADRALGDLRRQMGKAWERSTVVLVSDHNWRQSGAFDGKISDRVPLYMKLPGGSVNHKVTAQVPARILPYAILAVLRARIRTSDELMAFVEAGIDEPLR